MTTEQLDLSDWSKGTETRVLAERLNEVIAVLNNTRQYTVGGFMDVLTEAMAVQPKEDE